MLPTVCFAINDDVLLQSVETMSNQQDALRYEIKQTMEINAIADEKNQRPVRMKILVGLMGRPSRQWKIGLRLPGTNSVGANQREEWALNDVYLNTLYTPPVSIAGFDKLSVNARMYFPTGDDSRVRTGNQGSAFANATLKRPVGRWTTHLSLEGQVWNTRRDEMIRRDGTKSSNVQNVVSEMAAIQWDCTRSLSLFHTAGLTRTVRQPYKDKARQIDEGIWAESLAASIGENSSVLLVYQQTRDLSSQNSWIPYNAIESQWTLEWSWVL